MSAADDLKACAAASEPGAEMPSDVLDVMVKISQAIDGIPVYLAQAGLLSLIVSSAEAFPQSREQTLSLADGLEIAARGIRALAAGMPEGGVVQ